MEAITCFRISKISIVIAKYTDIIDYVDIVCYICLALPFASRLTDATKVSETGGRTRSISQLQQLPLSLISLAE